MTYLVANGYTHRDIADFFHISLSTVHNRRVLFGMVAPRSGKPPVKPRVVVPYVPRKPRIKVSQAGQNVADVAPRAWFQV